MPNRLKEDSQLEMSLKKGTKILCLDRKKWKTVYVFCKLQSQWHCALKIYYINHWIVIKLLKSSYYNLRNLIITSNCINGLFELKYPCIHHEFYVYTIQAEYGQCLWENYLKAIGWLTEVKRKSKATSMSQPNMIRTMASSLLNTKCYRVHAATMKGLCPALTDCKTDFWCNIFSVVSSHSTSKPHDYAICKKSSGKLIYDPFISIFGLSLSPTDIQMSGRTLNAGWRQCLCIPAI